MDISFARGLFPSGVDDAERSAAERLMGQCDYSAPSYHGSPEELDALRAGSWVTQFKEMAKAFSHRPTLMSLDDDREHVKHDGKLVGYLYPKPSARTMSHIFAILPRLIGGRSAISACVSSHSCQ